MEKHQMNYWRNLWTDGLLAIDIYLFYDIINKKDVTALTYGLIENSMDSLNEAVNYYSSGKEYNDERSYKFCIIMLYHSAELIMKEVLYREHPVLLYECIDNYRHNSNAGKTIGFTVALSRIKNISHLYANVQIVIALQWCEDQVIISGCVHPASIPCQTAIFMH